MSTHTDRLESALMFLYILEKLDIIGYSARLHAGLRMYEMVRRLYPVLEWNEMWGEA
jgi:hypothetical protein